MKAKPILLLIALVSLVSCQTMESATSIATTIGQSAGVVSSSQAESIQKTARAVSRSAEEFTPEQEYYIGRSVGAVVLSKYPAYGDGKVNQYLNIIGQMLAQASDLPGIFGGYHFLVLNSNEINAFATPSGLVFVTRGLLRCCKNEDALAAVLAHEISHIELRHGMQAIKKARITEALTTIAAEGAKTFGSKEVAALTETFGGTITDITNTMIEKGYSRSSEYEADLKAVKLLRRVGYDPNGLVEMLTAMKKNLKAGGLDFAKTHPSPENRIEEIQKDGLKYATVKAPTTRKQRFQQMLGKI
ncbi:MAG: M48 family metalloprotease [Desulfobacterales bacterium]